MPISQQTLNSRFAYLSRIHFLSDLNMDDRPECFRLYRYMQFEHLVKTLKEKTLAFMTPAKWEDKLECRYWKTDYTELNPGFEEPAFACLCATSESLEDSAASWKLYRREPWEIQRFDYDNNLVRVALNYEKFLEELNSWAERNDSQIYVCAANYSYNQTQLKSEIDKNPQIFPCGFDIEDYFRVLCLKRPNYSFEREIRTFAIEPRNGNKITNDILVLNNFDFASCITKILVSPAKEEQKSTLTKEIVKNAVDGFLDSRVMIETCHQFDKSNECQKIETQKMEKKEMKPLGKDTSYYTKGTIEEIALFDEKYYVKLKCAAGYSLKIDNKEYSLFLGAKDESKMVKMDKDVYYNLGLDEKRKDFILKAFELKKEIVVEVSGGEPKVDEQSNESSTCKKCSLEVCALRILQ